MNETTAENARPRSAAIFVFLALLLIAGGALALAVAWRKTFDEAAAANVIVEPAGNLTSRG